MASAPAHLRRKICNGPVVLFSNPPLTLVSKPYGQDMCLLGQWQLAMLK